MKNYCEIYFQTLAIRYLEVSEGQKVKIVMAGDENTPDEKADQD
jgi:hypothetical protein